MEQKKENSLKYIYFTLFALVLLILSLSYKQSSNNILGLPVNTCTDSDNGLTYDVAGYVTTNTNTYYDTCLSSTILKEIYCQSDLAYTSVYTCLGSCIAGACSTNTTNLVISSVESSAITTSKAKIIWDTNELSDSQVRYGTTTDYSLSTILNPNLSTSHLQILSGLQPNKIYYYRVKSRGSSGNLVISPGYTFTTSSLFASPFGYHFEGKADLNIIAANITENLGVKGMRYDLDLNNTNYTALDEFFSVLPNDVVVMATLFNSESNPGYPTNMTDYLNRVKNIVTRYKGRVKIWEIENEVYGGPAIPHWWATREQYVVTLNNAYSAIKSVDPDAIVIASGIATGTLTGPLPLGNLPNIEDIPPFDPNPPTLNDTELAAMEREAEIFIGYVWKYGTFDDIVDMHIYDYPDAINVRLDWINGELENYSLEKNVMLSETASIDLRLTGGHNPYALEEERRIQAIELVKRYAFISEKGVISGMWQGIYRDLEDIEGIDEHGNINGGIVFGVNQLKRPAYYNLEMLINDLEGFTSVTKINEGQYEFIVNDSPLFILWNPTNETNVIDLSSYTLSNAVSIKHIVTSLDENNNPIYLPDEVMPANAIIINEEPIIITPLNILVKTEVQSPIQRVLKSIFG